jgi:hypothetical protein
LDGEGEAMQHENLFVMRDKDTLQLRRGTAIIALCGFEEAATWEAIQRFAENKDRSDREIEIDEEGRQHIRR